MSGGSLPICQLTEQLTTAWRDPTPANPAGCDRLTPPPAAETGEDPVHRWAALAVLCAAALVINLDNTILNVALPTLVRVLRASSSELQWIVDSYAMVFAGLLLVGGSLADRFGRKRFFLIGLSVFAAASVGASVSGSVGPLIGFRAVMGAGAALTIPSSLSIINDVFRDPNERARAIGTWGGTIGLGIAVGPIAGGLLLTKFWWGSIFLVNVPIVAVAFLAAVTLVPDSKNETAERPDPVGAVLSVLGLGLLLWAIIEGPIRGWTFVGVVVAELASVAVLGSFVIWEAHFQHPMLKLKFFSQRRFSAAAGAETLGTFALLGALFLQTQFLQFDLGNSPLEAGLRILPLAGMLVISASMSASISRFIGVKFTVAAGMSAVAGGLWQISAVSAVATTFTQVLPGLLLVGLGAGLLLPTATNSVVGSVPRVESAIGSATNAVALQVGGAFGVAVLGSVMSTRYRNHMVADLAGRRVPVAASHTILGSLGGALAVAKGVGGATGAALSYAARAGFMSGVKISLAVGGCVAIAGAALVLAWLPSRASTIVDEPTQVSATDPTDDSCDSQSESIRPVGA